MGSAQLQQRKRGAGSAVKGRRNWSFTRKKTLRMAKQKWKI